MIATTNYHTYFENALAAGRKANLTPALVNSVLEDLAIAAVEQTGLLLAENQRDLDRMNSSDPKFDRLKLTPERIKGIADDISAVAKLKVL